MQQMTRTYSGKTSQDCQFQFDNDRNVLQSQGWTVVATNPSDDTKGNAAAFWALVILGFFTLITFFIAPFFWPRGGHSVTATYQRDGGQAL